MDTKKVQFKPWSYRNAPRLLSKAFSRYIAEREGVSLTIASRYFLQLREISHKAQKEGRLSNMIIDLDKSLGEWGGVETPYHRESYGLDRKGRKPVAETYRGKFGGIGEGGCTKAEYIAGIREIENCSQSVAETIFESCRRKEIARYCPETGLWYGCLVEEAPILAGKPAKVMKKTEYREKYGRMPELTHDWQNPGQSEHLRWIMETAGVNDLTEAEKIRRRAWNAAEAIWKRTGRRGANGLNTVCGVDLEHITEPTEAAPTKSERKVKVKPVYNVEWDKDENETITVAGNEITAGQDNEIRSMNPMSEDEAAQALLNYFDFSFDARRFLREQTGEHFQFEDGRYFGSRYKERQERKAAEEAEKEAKRAAKEERQRKKQEEIQIQLERIRIENERRAEERKEEERKASELAALKPMGFRGKATFKKPTPEELASLEEVNAD